VAEEIEVGGIIIKNQSSFNENNPEGTEGEESDVDDISSSDMAGNGEIAVGDNSVVIQTIAIKENDRIFITPRVLTARNIAVTEIDDGEGFKVEVMGDITEDEGVIRFDWLIIGQ